MQSIHPIASVPNHHEVSALKRWISLYFHTFGEAGGGDDRHGRILRDMVKVGNVGDMDRRLESHFTQIPLRSKGQNGKRKRGGFREEEG